METKLNDNEVRDIARMQELIDSYGQFISTLHIMIKARRTDMVYLESYHSPLREPMSKVFRWVKEKIKEEQ